MSEVLTMKQAAAFLGIHEQTGYVLARAGRIPGQKVGGQWRFSRTTLDKWLQGGWRGPLPPPPALPQ